MVSSFFKWAAGVFDDSPRLSGAVAIFASLNLVRVGHRRWAPLGWSWFDGPHSPWVVSLLLIVGGFGLFRRQRWGWWLLLLAVASMTSRIAWRMVEQGLVSTSGLVILIMALGWGYHLWTLDLEAPAGEADAEEDSEDRVIVALLLKSYRPIDSRILAACAERAFGVPFYRLQCTAEDDAVDNN